MRPLISNYSDVFHIPRANFQVPSGCFLRTRSSLPRTPISISSLARGNYARTLRRTTPCTLPWARRSMLPS
jgi:hypothetical protein